MKDNLYLRIFGVVCVLVIIVCLFLPFYDYDSMSSSLFSLNEDLNYISYIFIGFGVISLLTLLLNKKTELSYLLVGSIITYVVTMTIAFMDSFKIFGYGYYLIGLSTILLFISLILMGINKIKSTKIIDKHLESEEHINSLNSINNTNNINNIEPNDLAKSLMEQPVMNNLSEQTLPLENSNLNSSININESSSENIDYNISNESNVEDKVTLAPQNPLNSFLPSDFDSTKIETNEVKEDSNGQFNNNENAKNSDNSQSIMSVMSQPMVNSQLDFSNNMVGNNQNNNSSAVSLDSLSSNQSVVEPSMVQPEINNQSVVEPSISFNNE